MNIVSIFLFFYFLIVTTLREENVFVGLMVRSILEESKVVLSKQTNGAGRIASHNSPLFGGVGLKLVSPTGSFFRRGQVDPKGLTLPNYQYDI